MASSYEPAENITDEGQNIYDARDVRYATPQVLRNLFLALRTGINKFTVEFLHVNPVKPHVVFKLNLASPIGNIKSVRVSLELGEGDKTGEQGPGACQIKLCNYAAATRRAVASFQFQLRRQITLHDMIKLITGQFTPMPANMRADMRFFDFVDINNYFDGCRD